MSDKVQTVLPPEGAAFIEEVRQIPWLEPQGEPGPEWRVFATSQEAWEAVQGPTLGWVHLDTSKDPNWERAWDVMRIASLRSGRYSDWGQTLVSATHYCRVMLNRRLAAAGFSLREHIVAEAERDVTLWVYALETQSILGAENEAVQHARARLEIWRRGYGLLCDMGHNRSKFYVYRGA